MHTLLPLRKMSFNRQLLESAEALKALAIWKRVRSSTRRPIYPREETSNIPETPEQMKTRAREMLEAMRALCCLGHRIGGYNLRRGDGRNREGMGSN